MPLETAIFTCANRNYLQTSSRGQHSLKGPSLTLQAMASSPPSGVITKYTRWQLLSGAWLHHTRGICCFVVLHHHTWSLQMLQTGTTSSWYNRHNTPDTLAYRNERCSYAAAGLGLQILQQLGGINTVMVSSPYQTSFRSVKTNAALCWCVLGRSSVHM